MGIFNLFGKKEKQVLKGYFSLQISNIEKLNSKAVRVEFEVPSALESKFKFEPGQYVNLVLNMETSKPFLLLNKFFFFSLKPLFLLRHKALQSCH